MTVHDLPPEPTGAVEQRLRMLGEIVDDYVAKHGPFSDEVTRKVEAEWRAALARDEGA